MDYLNATDVRKNWSITLDSVVHDKPAYIKRTRDEIAMMDVRMLSYLLKIYQYIAEKYVEPDGSITLSLKDMDLVVNSIDEESAKDELSGEILEYAEEYYKDFSIWSTATNRQNHIPYVIKALMMDRESIRESIICLDGKN